MTVVELYKRFLIKVNKNDTNEGIRIPKGNFILLFNTEMLRWLSEELKKDIDNIDSNLIELLYRPNYPLHMIKTESQFVDYHQPEDMVQAYGSYSYCSKGNCENIKLFNYEIKPGNFIPVQQDLNSRSDFEYEEGRFVLTES